MEPRHSSQRSQRRTFWALALAGAILVLSVLAGPDTVHHVRPWGKDFHSCSLYHWAHGASAGTPSCFVLSAALPASGSTAAPSPIAAPDAPAHPAPSRAPPAIA